MGFSPRGSCEKSKTDVAVSEKSVTTDRVVRQAPRLGCASQTSGHPPDVSWFMAAESKFHLAVERKDNSGLYNTSLEQGQDLFVSPGRSG